jgi:hypothetical protein
MIADALCRSPLPLAGEAAPKARVRGSLAETPAPEALIRRAVHATFSRAREKGKR